MSPTEIAGAVGRGIELRKIIKTAQAELKTIEKRLEKAGLEGEQIPLQDEDREGRQFLARCGDIVVPVVFESDQITASFKTQSPMHLALAEIAGGDLLSFYVPSNTFERLPKDGQAFRRTARELLGATAPAFISASLQRDKNGIPKSRTIIAWDNTRDPA